MRQRAILVLMWMLLFSAGTRGVAADAVISDIKVSADKEIEKVQLIFQTSYSETISTDFENGLVQITLPHTSFDKSLAFTNVNDRFIRNIRLIKTATSSILEIHFANPSFDAIGMIKEKASGPQLDILISKTTRFPDKEPAKRGELGTVASKDTGSPEMPQTNASFLDSDMTVNIVKMLGALFLLLLFFYLLLWAYNRFFSSRFRFHKGQHNIKVSASYHISPKQKIIILEVNNTAYACGVTANNISVISKVSKDSFSDYIANLDLNGEISFADIRTQYLEAKQKQETLEEAVSSDSKFASELIQRIKGLKPLD